MREISGLATLHARNPRLIVLRLTGFGQTGPYARKPGFARIFEAMSGFTHLTGEPGGPPQHMNYPLGDAVAGLFGAFAIASALAERNAQPPAQQRGVEIDLSATEAMVRLLDPLAAEHAISGLVRERTGSRAGYTAPSNVYRTADGAWITLVGSSDPIFLRLCEAMGQPALAADARFSTNVERTRHLVELDALVAQWCAALPLAALQERLEQAQVPCSKVYSIEDMVGDPHFRARGTFTTLHDEDIGDIPVPAVVPRFTGRMPPHLRAGPDTGRDNEEVYGALGLSAQELARLRTCQVVN